MLAAALKFHMELDLTHSKELTQLIENFGHKRPPASNLVQRWDLDFVLWTLMDKPFEPTWDDIQVPPPISLGR